MAKPNTRRSLQYQKLTFRLLSGKPVSVRTNVGAPITKVRGRLQRYLGMQCFLMFEGRTLDDNDVVTQQMLPPNEIQVVVMQHGLTRYLLKRSSGDNDVELPDDYEHGNGCVGHKETGITLKCPPVRAATDEEDDVILLYHYASESSYSRIVASTELTHLRASYAERAHFGDGVYVTQYSPDWFGSKDAILKNNYTNKDDPNEQEAQIAEWRERGAVDCCIPVVVPRSAAVNVMFQTTKEMTIPGHTARHNAPIRRDRDVWVIPPGDAAGQAQSVCENPATSLKRLNDTDPFVRLHAVEVLAGIVATSVDQGATDAILNSLQDEDDPEVCIATVWAVACSKALTVAEALKHIEQVSDHKGHPKVKDALLSAREVLMGVPDSSTEIGGDQETDCEAADDL